MSDHLTEEQQQKRTCFLELVRLRDRLEAEQGGEQFAEALIDFLATMKAERQMSDEQMGRISRIAGL
ncbi:MAG TPA: hypothetical protein DDW52_14325 [Planctomycetaceae bacterium]|nr:hypothetical protein [Planctomycetaceae bacterium]